MWIFIIGFICGMLTLPMAFLIFCGIVAFRLKTQEMLGNNGQE